MNMSMVRNVLALAVSAMLAACVGSDGDDVEASNRTEAEIQSVLDLVEAGDAPSILRAYEMWEGANEAASRRLVEAVQRGEEYPQLQEQTSWSGVGLPVSWSVWPTGIHPYSATSEYGNCGSDTDLVAKYRGVSFSSPTQLYLTTNNAVTYTVAALQRPSLRLTAYHADNVAGRVSVCAGMGPFAGLPVVQDQLSSMTLNVSR
ncbi:hypothetical protein WME98_10585 [Sorangium sp. So ce296]|uniref:Lipoprotein n=1 Tax=Sorangium cellulosum So0157-2 TaxID=1254432 RepID=S4Y6N9_SORCE|nr:hypothetical protein [Sorangium cellulosum]AGP38543.1 hypothetical protein SCE1572_31150 [Sorangium cellulosum So0157-2]